jgi:uncharacterized protein
MDWKKESPRLALLAAVFLGLFYLPASNPRFLGAIAEALALVKWYAREHVILCLIPAFFIAGAISVFVSQASVMKYLGPKSNKGAAYGIASVSGIILAVCSCTVLPLFAGIWRMGAGLGPAAAFLYAGPAINILAIILTARILGFELGLARAVGAIGFSIVIGLLMHLFFLKEERQRAEDAEALPVPEPSRPLWQNAIYFAAMVGILVFANWSRPGSDAGFFAAVWQYKWMLTAGFAVVLAWVMAAWFGLRRELVVCAALPVAVLGFAFTREPMIAFVAGVIGLSVIAARSGGEASEWLSASWTLAKQILPLLFIGVLISGLLLGRPGHEGLIPSAWIEAAVGGNSLRANLFSSVVGAFMYFATLTEVPILQGLLGAGMGKGPALALLLAGPALSLPNMLVLRSIMGLKKTAVYIVLVVIMATVSGLIYGSLF